MNIKAKEILFIEILIIFLGIFGLFFEVVFASDYIIFDQTSCDALPGSSTWISSSSECNISSDLTIGSSDTLTIPSPVRLSIASDHLLTNNGGITVNFGGKLRVSGTLVNNNGGQILSSGFWDIRDWGSMTNNLGGEIETANQLHITQGSLTNSGTLTNGTGGYLSITQLSSFTNSGTLINDYNIKSEGQFTNSGLIQNNGSFENSCGTFINAGTITGNPIDNPFCWTGAGSGSSWFTPGNWNQNAIPPPNQKIIIESGSGNPVIDSNLTFSGIMEIKLKQLIIGSGVSFINNGTISNFGLNFPNTSIITNNGQFTNNNLVYNNDALVNNNIFINNSNINVTTRLGELRNSGTFSNSGSGYIRNGLNNLSTGVFNNSGTFDMERSENDNFGSFSNLTGGNLNINNELNNNNGGFIENSATININHTLNFPGELINKAGASILNKNGATIAITATGSAIDNDGVINNFGLISNGGTITNNGFLCGQITGNPVEGDPLSPSCDSDWDGVADHLDCDPLDPDIFPGAIESCDEKDNDCDDEVDEAGAQGCTIYYRDEDEDGYGVDGYSLCLCSPDVPGKYTATQGGDPDDSNPDIPANIVTMDMNLPAGWSMISLPVESDNRQVQVLFPDATAVFKFTNKYEFLQPSDDMEIGRGYWIYMPQAATYQLTGLIFDQVTLSNAQNGWSMVGACTSPSGPSVTNGTIEAVFGFSNKYDFLGSGTSIQPLQPTKGYWINLSETADISISRIE